jgi:deoxyadenosine/deoxycytidine kinase
MLSSLPKPDLLIYLHTNIKSLQANIKKRDRSYERDITDEYLLKIQEKYFDFFKKQKDFPVLIIDIIDADFINDNTTYRKIISAIKQPYSLGVHQIDL